MTLKGPFGSPTIPSTSISSLATLTMVRQDRCLPRRQTHPCKRAHLTILRARQVPLVRPSIPIPIHTGARIRAHTPSPREISGNQPGSIVPLTTISRHLTYVACFMPIAPFQTRIGEGFVLFLFFVLHQCTPYILYQL